MTGFQEGTVVPAPAPLPQFLPAAWTNIRQYTEQARIISDRSESLEAIRTRLPPTGTVTLFDAIGYTTDEDDECELPWFPDLS